MISNFLKAPLFTYEPKKGLKWFSMKWQELLEMKIKATSITNEEKYEFFRLLYTTTLSWVTTEEALIIIRDSTWSQKIEKISKICLKNIWTWNEFWQTLTLFPKAFEEKEIWLIKTWEESWKLTIILAKLIEDLERAREIKWEIKSALVMPWITMVAAFWAMYVLLTFVLPKFTEQFKTSWQELPWITKVIMAMSDALINYPIIVPAILFFIWWIYQATTFGPWLKLKHRIHLRIPFFTNKFIIPYELSNFITTLELMTSSWVDIIESTKKARKSLSNQILQEEVDKITEQLQKWVWFSWALHKFKVRDKKTRKLINTSKLFSLPVLSVLEVWDMNWSLNNVLNVQKKLTNIEILSNIKQISKAIEPLSVLFIAALVLPIILAIILPYFSNIQHLVENIWA